MKGVPRDWGSGRHRQVGNGIDFDLEQLTEAELAVAVENGAADLEQKISTAAGPSHLLRFVHAVVDQEVGGCFRQRGTDPQTSAMAFGLPSDWGSGTGQGMTILEFDRLGIKDGVGFAPGGG
jgi:hypothetical protein